ncbi:MAG TPA: bifunctional nuclease family protein [Dehalococcoidia bacterium]|nr:bifunctional nuclease family protein [Dehalococcoidia bacterium]
MLEMTIDSIRVSMMNYQHVVILKEKNTDRYLPIWIGPSEADAISVKLQNIHLSRPLTHDLLKNTIFALESISGTTISKVVVSDLRADTFFAQIVFEVNDGPTPIIMNALGENYLYGEKDKDKPVSFIWQSKRYDVKVIDGLQEGQRYLVQLANDDGLIFEVTYDSNEQRWLLARIKLDSRPSDAIALAVRVTTPIFVEEAVLEKAGIVLDKDTGKPLSAHKGMAVNNRGDTKLNEQEFKRYPAIYDFINTLDVDDLGKRQS